MRRQYAADAAAAAPPAPASPSAGYPTEGDPANGVLATLLGEFWVHLVTEAICTTIERAGLQLSDDPDQFRDALLVLFPTKAALAQAIAAFATEQFVLDRIAAIAFPDSGPDLATVAEHLAANPPANKAATPTGVRAVRDMLLDAPPGALDTLNELAAALGDDANFSATISAAINLRARLDGATFTGITRGLTPPVGDDSTRFATTEWVNDNAGGVGTVDFFSVAAPGDTLSGSFAAARQNGIVGLLLQASSIPDPGSGALVATLSAGAATVTSELSVPRGGPWAQILFLHKPATTIGVLYQVGTPIGQDLEVGSSLTAFDIDERAVADILTADKDVATPSGTIAEVTITPPSAAARIKLDFSAYANVSRQRGTFDVTLERGNVELAGFAEGSYGTSQADNFRSQPGARHWIDTPNTDQPVTYRLKLDAGSTSVGGGVVPYERGSFLMARPI